MRNTDRWLPTKFVRRHGRLRGSRDPKVVGIGSRLVADLIAGWYDAHIKEHVRGRLIDLGCGEVPLFDAYRELVSSSVCVDWPNSSHGVRYLDCACDLGKDLPFKNGQFDTILLSDVLEHVPEPDRLWKEMSRILARRGKILMNVPFYYRLHEEPYDYYRYTEFALRRFATSAGLKVVLLEHVGGAPEILADLLAKNIVRVRAWGRLLATVIQQLELSWGKTQLGRRVANETGRKFPFLYFVVAEK